MLSVFLIHIVSLMSLPALSASQSITLAFSQSITWFSLQTWSVITDLLQILAVLVFSALVKIPVMLSTSLRCSFTLVRIVKKWTASQESSLEQKRPGQPVSVTNLQSQICNHRSCLQWESRERLGERQGDWSRSRQSWQTHKGGKMDQEDRQHESTWGELPVEPRMGQAFTYWRPAPEVSPDEGFRREAEKSINSMLF